MVNNIIEILLLSVALAMDCFTVSIVSGVIIRDCFKLPCLSLAGWAQADLQAI